MVGFTLHSKVVRDHIQREVTMESEEIGRSLSNENLGPALNSELMIQTNFPKPSFGGGFQRQVSEYEGPVTNELEPQSFADAVNLETVDEFPQPLEILSAREALLSAKSSSKMLDSARRAEVETKVESPRASQAPEELIESSLPNIENKAENISAVVPSAEAADSKPDINFTSQVDDAVFLVDAKESKATDAKSESVEKGVSEAQQAEATDTADSKPGSATVEIDAKDFKTTEQAEDKISGAVPIESETGESKPENMVSAEIDAKESKQVKVADENPSGSESQSAEKETQVSEAADSKPDIIAAAAEIDTKESKPVEESEDKMTAEIQATENSAGAQDDEKLSVPQNNAESKSGDAADEKSAEKSSSAAEAPQAEEADSKEAQAKQSSESVGDQKFDADDKTALDEISGAKGTGASEGDQSEQAAASDASGQNAGSENVDAAQPKLKASQSTKASENKTNEAPTGEKEPAESELPPDNQEVKEANRAEEKAGEVQPDEKPGESNVDGNSDIKDVPVSDEPAEKESDSTKPLSPRADASSRAKASVKASGKASTKTDGVIVSAEEDVSMKESNPGGDSTAVAGTEVQAESKDVVEVEDSNSADRVDGKVAAVSSKVNAAVSSKVDAAEKGAVSSKINADEKGGAAVSSMVGAAVSSKVNADEKAAAVSSVVNADEKVTGVSSEVNADERVGAASTKVTASSSKVKPEEKGGAVSSKVNADEKGGATSSEVNADERVAAASSKVTAASSKVNIDEKATSFKVNAAVSTKNNSEKAEENKDSNESVPQSQTSVRAGSPRSIAASSGGDLSSGAAAEKPTDQEEGAETKEDAKGDDRPFARPTSSSKSASPKFSVVIEGVTGRVAYEVNGVYDPTEETCGGYPVFVKRKDKRKWLEFNASLQRWQVKPTAGKGADMCWAYLDGDLETSAALTLWAYRGEGSWWSEQKEAVVEEVDGDKIVLSGFVGQHARKICGTYSRIEPTGDSTFPTYECESADGVKLIEYHAETRTWQLKPGSCRGVDSCWAYVFNRKGTAPQTSTNTWVAKDSFELQSAAKVYVEAFTGNFKVFSSN